MGKRRKHPYARRSVVGKGGGSVTVQTNYTFPEDDLKRAQCIYGSADQTTKQRQNENNVRGPEGST